MDSYEQQIVALENRIADFLNTYTGGTERARVNQILHRLFLDDELDAEQKTLAALQNDMKDSDRIIGPGAGLAETTRRALVAAFDSITLKITDSKLRMYILTQIRFNAWKVLQAFFTAGGIYRTPATPWEVFRKEGDPNVMGESTAINDP